MLYGITIGLKANLEAWRDILKRFIFGRKPIEMNVLPPFLEKLYHFEVTQTLTLFPKMWSCFCSTHHFPFIMLITGERNYAGFSMNIALEWDQKWVRTRKKKPKNILVFLFKSYSLAKSGMNWCLVVVFSYRCWVHMHVRKTPWRLSRDCLVKNQDVFVIN